jgi:sn-glycerol 3-phosphate transport system ATP-binding protein
MIYVTHDQTEAMAMADQVVLLRAGKIEQDAPPDELYAAPATSFAAGFVGTPPMNLFRLPDDNTLLGIRPEAVRVGGEGHRARVADAEYLGADTVMSCDMHGQKLLVRLPGKAPQMPGEDVLLAFDPADLHRFDPDTGRRLA